MTKKDLRNGDIVVLREGELGLYLAEKDVFIYQKCGIGFSDSFLLCR